MEIYIGWSLNYFEEYIFDVGRVSILTLGTEHFGYAKHVEMLSVLKLRVF